MMNIIIPPMVEAEAARHGSLTSQQRQVVSDAARDSFVALIPSITDEMARLLAQRMTEPQLEATVAFYESEAGRRLMEATAGTDQDFEIAFRRLMPQFMDDMTRRVCQRMQCDPADLRQRRQS
jgi:hypothetical protein